VEVTVAALPPTDTDPDDEPTDEWPTASLPAPRPALREQRGRDWSVELLLLFVAGVVSIRVLDGLARDEGATTPMIGLSVLVVGCLALALTSIARHVLHSER
jgi:hypothetical protein